MGNQQNGKSQTSYKKKKKKVTNGLMRCDNDIRASVKILVYLV